MKAFGTLLGMVFGLVLLAAFLVGGYFLFKYVVDLFDTLEPQVKAITVIASIVAVLCAMIIAGGLRSRSQKEDSSSTAIEKTNSYERLLTFWSERLKRLAGGEGLVADSELINLEQQLALHGSSKVITAYMKLRRLARQGGEPGGEVPSLLNKLALEMREDLGRATLNLEGSDLLDLLLGRN